MAQFPCPSCSVLMASDKLTCSVCGYRLKVDKTETGSYGVEEELRIPNWMIEEAARTKRKKINWVHLGTKATEPHKIPSQNLSSPSSWKTNRKPMSSFLAETPSGKVTRYNIYALFFVALMVSLSYLFRASFSSNPQVLPGLTVGLCVVATTIYLNSLALRPRLVFQPSLVARFGEAYRVITAGFVHLDLTHLLFNSVALYSFGPFMLEYLVGKFGLFGPCIFAVLFLMFMALADIPDLILHRGNPSFSSAGASGGIAGVVATTAVAYPHLRISGVPAPVYVVGYFVISLGFAFKGNGKMAHLAHAAGTAVGVIAAFALINLQGLSSNAQISTPTVTSSNSPTITLVERLSAASGAPWQTQSIAGQESSHIISSQSLGECFVWEFPTLDDAKFQAQNFTTPPGNSSTFKLWSGLDVDQKSGIVLIAPDSSASCALAAVNALHWEPLSNN